MTRGKKKKIKPRNPVARQVKSRRAISIPNKKKDVRPEVDPPCPVQDD